MKNSAVKIILSVVSIIALMLVGCSFLSGVEKNPADKIFYGGTIITMEGSAPQYAQAVATRQDKIIFAGSRNGALRYKGEGTELIDLKGQTMFPGFIDPHLHPAAIAVFYYSTNIRADEDWHIPGLKNILVTSHDGYIEALKKAEAELKGPSEWLVVGGYASYYHGKIDKADLEQISASRPIIMFQRSFHETWLNSKAMEIMGFTEENCKGDPTKDFANGHFFEGACIETIWPKMIGILLYGDRWQKALQAGVEYLHKNGITTIMDPLAFDGFTKEEIGQFREIYGGKDSPLRTYMVAEPRMVFEKGGADAAIAFIDGLSKKDGVNIKYMKAVKGFVDGAFFAQLMRLKGGYTDGRQGVWITPPDELKEIVTVFWNKNYPLHIHINGDEGLDWALDTFAVLKKNNPKSTSRVVFHHLGYASPDQVKKMKELGIYASVQPYYIHALGDIYATHGFGPERAEHISPTGAFVKEGIITSLHSDFFMGPSNPLYLAWCAVNRIGVISGKVLGPEDRLTVYQAMRAITIDAAYTLSLEDEIGSIKAGKKADFTILTENPLKIDPLKLKDIKIVAKVFNGKYYELNK